MAKDADADTPSEGVRGSSRGAVFRHPLVVGATIALLSTVLASLLIPSLTRTWQDRPRELALKRSLVGQIARAGADAVEGANSFGFIITRTKTSTAKRKALYASAWRKWRVDSAVIASQLSTYFRGTSLVEQWRAYSDAVLTFLNFALYAKGSTKQVRSHDAEHHFRAARFDEPDQEGTRRAWFLGSVHSASGGARPIFAILLGYEQDQIANRVITSNASGFSHGVWIFG